MSRTASTLLGRSYLSTDRTLRFTAITRRFSGASWQSFAEDIALALHRDAHAEDIAACPEDGLDQFVPVVLRNETCASEVGGWLCYSVSVGFEGQGPSGAMVVARRADGSWWLREFGGW